MMGKARRRVSMMGKVRNLAESKNYSLWSCLSKYISIKRYFFRTGSKKEKKNKIRKCQMRLVGFFSMSCLMMFNMYSNVSLDTRKRFLNSLSSQLLYPSIHYDLFRTLLLSLSFLSSTCHKAATAGTITSISSSISSSFIFLFLLHIWSISSISSSHFLKIFSKSF